MNKVLPQIKKKILENLEDILCLRKNRETKDDGSYITKGDLLVQEIVYKCIGKLLKDVVVISEESPLPKADELEGKVLILDPIDGTENFTSGLSEWGISLCLYENGQHVESLIFCPEMDIALHSDDSVPQFESRITGLSSSLSRADFELIHEGFEYRIMGCCVYNMINVIKGCYSSFQNPKGANIWDIIAGLNIALNNNLDVLVEDQPYDGILLEPDQKYRFKISR